MTKLIHVILQCAIVLLGASLVLAARLTATPSLSLCPEKTTPPRQHVCPLPILSNITDYGPWSYNGTNRYNKSWDVRWVTEYNKALDDRSLDPAVCDNNPYNYFERECTFIMNCNATNQTKSVVKFYGLNVTLDTGDVLITQLLIDVELTRVVVGYNNSMFNSTVIRWIDVMSPLFQEPDRPAYMMNNFTQRGLTLTTHSMEYAVSRMKLFVPIGQKSTMEQKFVKFNVSAHYECNVEIINVTVFYTDDYAGGLGLALAIPLVVIVLLGLLAFLRYKGCCKCCESDKDGKEGVDDDSAIRRQQQKRDGLSQPLNIDNRAGMQTWLDQADEVVADLNQNCLYLEEAKTDTAMNQVELDTVAGSGTGGRGPAFNAQTEGFVGDRRLWAAGGAQVVQKDHKPQMQTRALDDDVAL